MSEAHEFTGLFPGDYFIHRFDFDGHVTFAYGFLRNISNNGQYEADYKCQQPPKQPATVEKDSHMVVGRINKRAYILARLRGWPNTKPEVDAIIAYSAGQSVYLSFGEHLRLLLVR